MEGLNSKNKNKNIKGGGSPYNNEKYTEYSEIFSNIMKLN